MRRPALKEQSSGSIRTHRDTSTTRPSRWVEAAEAQLVRDLGLDDYFPAAPRVRQEINYRTKLWFGQPVTATVAVVKMGRSSMTYAFEVVGHPFAGHAGGTAATALSRWFMFR